MKLLRLQAQNFRCFEHLDLDLNVDGLVAVVGDNGAGKSTIFAAVEWAMYGGRRGRSTLPVRRDGCPEGDDCWAEVHFEVGQRAYRVRRVAGKQAELFDLPTGERITTGLESTSREVATRLGLTRDMFRGTFYAAQREVQALDSDEVKRRQQVELLLGIERLRQATAHAHAAAKEQRHVVTTMQAGVPDVDALRAEAERLTSEASQDAPVKKAEAALERAKQKREQAKKILAALRTQEREMIERRGRARTAATEAEQQRVAAQTLSEQLAQAEAAQAELAKLTPTAEQVETLIVAERKMDHERADDERATSLRERQHEALSRAARLADEIADLRGALIADDENDDSHAQIEAVEGEIDALHLELSRLSETQQSIERRMRETRERIVRGERAAELDTALADLPQAERAAEDAFSQWHALTAKRAQLEAAIAHDLDHRDAVLAGDKPAACPTCKRPYGEGEVEEIVAGYERDLQAAREELTALDRRLAEQNQAARRLRQRADDLRTKNADRRAISDAPTAGDLTVLREQLAADSSRAEQLVKDNESRKARLGHLTKSLQDLRKQARLEVERRQQMASLEAQREQAEREAQTAAEDLRGLDANGYDAAAHLRLRTELVEAQAASQRCAELRGKVDGLDLIRRRMEEQREVTAAAEKRRIDLEAALAQVDLDPEVVSRAEEASDLAEREADAAHRALLHANQQALLDAEALASANTRLQDARHQVAQLREQRVELRIRTEIATALGAFRDEASRRARPTLEHETALLLGEISRQRYNSVQLTDSYQLRIVDGDLVHPMARFSGGEQDLAGLCLRLALSRTLARQRGAETGFVMLDEVFGSQDAERRRALLEQLHAIADAEFRQVFVISHTDDVVEHCDLRIDVARGVGGASTAIGPRR